MKNPNFLTLTFSLVLFLGGCGKSVNLAETLGNLPILTPPANPACGATNLLHWSYTQPNATLNRALDVLFVLDTSEAASDERAQFAQDIGGYIQTLNPSRDLHFAVMLGHGGSSPYSGKLFSLKGTSAVLSTQKNSIAQIQFGLTSLITYAAPDLDFAEGEMPLYSFAKSQNSAQLAAIQAQDFFRPSASLSVVFMTDDSDICFLAENKEEQAAQTKYCKDSSGHLKITPASTLQLLDQLKPNHSYSVGAIAHLSESQLGKEDGIGHGVIETAQLARSGVTMELASRDYKAGLDHLFDLGVSELKLLTSFNLGGNSSIDPSSVLVSVDGVTVPYQYDLKTTNVQLALAQAGHAASKIEISACSLLITGN